MRKNKSEKQVLKEVARIVSMKEDLDAVSWARVAEIAKALQEDSASEDLQELGRELLSISQANSSLLGKFGTSVAGSGKVMPSGIEIMGNSSVLAADEAIAMATPSEQSAALIEIADEIEEVRLPDAFNLRSGVSAIETTQPIVMPIQPDAAPTQAYTMSVQTDPAPAEVPTHCEADSEEPALSWAAPDANTVSFEPASEASNAAGTSGSTGRIVEEVPAPSNQVDVNELVKAFRSKVASSAEGTYGGSQDLKASEGAAVTEASVETSAPGSMPVADPSPFDDEEEALEPVTLSALAAAASVIAEPLEPAPSLSEAVNLASPFFIIDAASEDFIPRGENTEEPSPAKPVFTPSFIETPIPVEDSVLPAMAEEKAPTEGPNEAFDKDEAPQERPDDAFGKAIAEALKQGGAGLGVAPIEAAQPKSAEPVSPLSERVQPDPEVVAEAGASIPVQAPPVQAPAPSADQAAAAARIPVSEQATPVQTPLQTTDQVTTDRVQESKPDDADSAQPQPVHKGKKLKSQDFARFRQLYSSRDGHLCVYEDSFGHLVAVDASKFA